MSDSEKVVVRPRIYAAEKRPLEELVPLKTPISAHVDISSLCNYRCSFCFQADTQGMKEVGLNRGFMEFSMFKKIVDTKDDMSCAQKFHWLFLFVFGIQE